MAFAWLALSLALPVHAGQKRIVRHWVGGGTLPPREGIPAKDATFLNTPMWGMTVDLQGTVYFSQPDYGIWKVGADGVLSTVTTDFQRTNSLVTDAEGNLYLSEWGKFRIWKLSPTGEKTLLAGAGGTDEPAQAGDIGTIGIEMSA